MKKLTQIFKDTPSSFSKELEQAIIQQYKIHEAALLEKFTAQAKEQLIPQIQKSFETLMGKYSVGLERALSNQVNKLTVEKEAVKGFSESLKDVITCNMAEMNKVEELLDSTFQEGGLASQVREHSPESTEKSDEKYLLEKIGSQQKQISELMSQLHLRITNLEKIDKPADDPNAPDVPQPTAPL